MAQRLGLHDAIVYHNANQPVRNWPGHRTAVGWIDSSRPCAPDSSQELEVEPEIQTDGEMAETRSDIYSWGHNLSPSHQSPPIQADLMPKPRDSAIQTDMMPKLKDTFRRWKWGRNWRPSGHNRPAPGGRRSWRGRHMAVPLLYLSPKRRRL